MFKRALCLMSTLLLAVCLFGQVLPVGTVDGTVTDPSAAVVSGVKITLTNLDTQQGLAATTNAAGYFFVPLVPPGRYQVAAVHAGFKKATQEVTVLTGRRSTADLSLEVGQVTEAVEVSGVAPLLETSTAAVSQQVQQRQVQELPLLGRNPLKLMLLAPGMTSTSTSTSNLTDISGTSYVSANGSNRRLNEFLLDGMPNNLTDRIAHIPTVDVVEEFTVQTNALDAEYGHGGGAYINVTTKSGTNEFHGVAYNFFQNDKLNANTFFNNRQNVPKSPLRYNQPGGAVGGPLIRNKTFWFFNWESVRQNSARTALYTAPTDLQRKGDFSQTFDRTNRRMDIYDPFSTRQVSGLWVRDPFPSNTIPSNRLDSVAARVIKDFPGPNTTGDPGSGTNNYIANVSVPFHLDTANVRLDHNLARHRLFGRWMMTNSETLNAQPFDPGGDHLNIRDQFSVAVSDTVTISPSTILTAQIGVNRHETPGVPPPYDTASLGFPTSLVSQMQQTIYPRFENSDMMAGGAIEGLIISSYNTYSAQAGLHKSQGKHNFKFGYQMQIKQSNSVPARYPSGRYIFSRAFTQGPDPNRSGTNVGNGIASMLLGTVGTGTLDIRAYGAGTGPYYAGYFQDDFRITQKLTLNLGLRYEITLPTTERYNRHTFGLDRTSSNPIEAQAKANYAKNPIPELSVQDFKVLGGLLFTSPAQRRNGYADKNNWAPRFGAAYRLHPGTVLRGGVGMFFNYYWAPFVRADGFASETSMVTTIDGGRTPADLLKNPFPQGLVQPIGSSQGMKTLLGQNIQAYDQNRKAFASTRWSFGIQQELGKSMAVEVNYVGQRGSDLPITSSAGSDDTRDINYLPAGFNSLGSKLQDSVANPFFGLIDSGNLSRATVARRQLLLQYPEFGTVSLQRESLGSSSYHSLQVSANRRMSKGLLVQSTYTWSKLLENLRYIDTSDPGPSKMIGEFDNPHRVTLAAIYELPFGRGRQMLANTPLLRDIAGGWQAGATYIYQAGNATGLPAALATGISPKKNGHDIENWFNRDAMKVLPAFTVRTIPYMWNDLRQDSQNNWDISILKDTVLYKERYKLQFRAELVNAFNHVWFGHPDVNPASGSYGRVLTQSNSPRQIQLALKFIF